jgi:hypothetical protein
MGRVGVVLGIVAILVLMGARSVLPSQVVFFVASLAVILFPGVVLTKSIAGRGLDRYSFPERLVLWFVVGTFAVTVVGFTGLLIHLRLSDVTHILVVLYALLAVLLFAAQRRRRPMGESPDLSPPGQPEVGIKGPVLSNREKWVIYLTLFGIAIGAALLTLLTPRDYDGWYYLAYIRDFVAGRPMGAENAIFGVGSATPARLWFGAAWWVLEAVLSKATGIDPVRCHQVYVPVLLSAFAVLAVFSLARQVFRSHRIALLATSLQVIFYLSSAFPYRSAGWGFFCRMSQDKFVSCFIIVPVAVALGLRLVARVTDGDTDERGGIQRLYWIALLTSVLVHGLGPVWCGLFIGPFVLAEFLRRRSRKAALSLVTVILPLIGLGLVLISARGVVMGEIIGPLPEATPAPGLLSNIYLPGDPFGYPMGTQNIMVQVYRENSIVLNPLFVTRYPLAIVGLILTPLLIPWLKSSSSARFLMCVTLTVLLLVFTPAGVTVTEWLMTRRLIFRMTWVLPWGLILAFFLSRMRVRPVVMWLAVIGLALGLARGRPQRYTASLIEMRSRNRPSPEAEAAFAYLGSQPSPQGVVLASEATGRMVAGFIPEAYPVNFREYGPVDRETLKSLVKQKQIDERFLQVINANNVKYVLLEKGLPLAGALAKNDAGFVLVYRNASYSIWQVESG